MDDFETFTARWERHQQAVKPVNEQNKTRLLDALAGADITRVAVEFDGEGDSGQINAVTAYKGEQQADIPPTKITVQNLSWGQAEPTSDEHALAAAIESVCYDFLEQEHGGWENNDGAYGEFHIDVKERTIELEFYSRYTDVEKYSHSF
ncbi:MAG: DUF6878 family protein [Bryobacteraceae bacterium]